MKLPKLDDLIGEQFKVYEHRPDEHLFVAGPPGSGKTSLAVLRAKFLTDFGQRVVLLTRNRMLATLARQLGEAVFNTATMHSHIATDHSRRLGIRVPQLVPFVYDWNQIWKAYAEKDLKPVVDHMVIDEGQNLPPPFFRWALEFGAKTLTVFADEDQATDENRSSLKDICDAGMSLPHRLAENHRNTEEIALLAEHFHRSHVLPPGVVRRGRGGEIPRLQRVSTWDEAVKRVATRYENRGGSVGVIVFRKSEAKELYRRLRMALTPPARVELYTSDMPKGAEINIHVLDPGITVLTSEAVIGLEFESVFLQDLNRSLPCTSAEQYRRMYMLCARARDSLMLIDGPDQLTADQIADLPDPTMLAR